jgi:hypothetical protein
MAEMSEFTCQALQIEQAATVFPLLREALPELDLKTWLRFARKALHRPAAGQCGIVVVHRQRRTFPCGVFVWRRERDLAQGDLLVAEHFIAVDVLDPEPVMAALVRELDVLAQRMGCAGIRTVLPGAGALADAGLRAAGHHVQGSTMWKPVSRKTAPNGKHD